MAEFSIIIPTLNEESGIVRCLTVLQAWRSQCEIIIADGGSTDNTVALAAPWADKVAAAGRGRARQMNCGAGHATGDILIFLHADTLLPATALTDIGQSINPKRQWGRFDIRLEGRHPFLKVIAFFMNWRSRLTGIATGDQAIFITRDLLEKSGWYPDIVLMEDIALSKTLKCFGPPICLKTKVISSGRRWQQFGVIKTMLLMWSLRLRYFFGADPRDLAASYYRGEIWKI